MSYFSSPEISKRWASVMDRPFKTFLRGEFILKQGEPFQDSYLIVQGQVEAYREVSSRKLGIKSHISFLGPYDVISIDSSVANYCIKVTSHLLRIIPLQQNQKHLMNGNSVKQWRSLKAQSLQRDYDIQKSLKKKSKSKPKFSIQKFIGNISNERHQTQMQTVKLPSLSKRQRVNSMKQIVDSKKTPMCKNPQILFQSIVRDYFGKKMDYQSKNITMTLKEMSKSRKLSRQRYAEL